MGSAVNEHTLENDMSYTTADYLNADAALLAAESDYWTAVERGADSAELAALSKRSAETVNEVERIVSGLKAQGDWEDALRAYNLANFAD